MGKDYFAGYNDGERHTYEAMLEVIDFLVLNIKKHRLNPNKLLDIANAVEQLIKEENE